MSNRIKELAKRCYETGPIGKDGWPDYSKFNEEKFAELIVRECLSYAKDGDIDFMKFMIKQHFGIEE